MSMGNEGRHSPESTEPAVASAQSSAQAVGTVPAACAGMRVVELGSRLAVGVCGRQLADLGAQVLVAEPRTARTDGKWADRAAATAGKHSVLFDLGWPADVEMLLALVASADVVLLSDDVDTVGEANAWPAPLASAIARCPIVCSLTAFGSTGPSSGGRSEFGTDETALQALTGLMATTGFPDGDPVAVGVPFIELSSALYAATAVLLAWRVLLRDGAGQQVEVALYDTAVNSLTTFLPGHFAGQATRRLGNGHGMAVPWNAYRTVDGWILICLANDPQWQRLAPLIDPALSSDPRFIVLNERVAHRAEIDAVVGAWTATRERDALVTLLSKAGLACGAIVPVAQLGDEPNLAHRGVVASVHDPLTGKPVRVPAPVIRLADSAPGAVNVPAVPRPDSGRALIDAARQRPVCAVGRATPNDAATTPAEHLPKTGTSTPLALPFAGLRVVEIGQFTTAPLTARYLANFGADVIKLEPEEGESARTWQPMRDGISHFFIMSNGTKRSVGVDLSSAAGQAMFARLLTGADVLVENLKAGALERLGFGPERLRTLNPRLVYCAISGFGRRSVYPGRPAFDTVVQAMSGMMDSTRDRGVPLKSGISSADIAGGQMGLLAIAAALQRREHSGQGAVIDLAMQDVGAWFTHPLWNRPSAPLPAAADRQGAQGGADGQRAAADGRTLTIAAKLPDGTPIADMAGVCANPQTGARELIVRRHAADGIEWELLGSPMRLSLTPAIYGTPIGRPVLSGLDTVDWLDATAAGH